MYRNKKDVDKHVQSLTSKLPLKEFQTRAYSIARLYFEVGDYASCQKYVEQYLAQKDNNAAAHKLLGLALQKMGQKQKALEHFKTSLDIDPTQTSTILEICELLCDDEVEIDVGRSKYWCEKAEAIFPRHPITFKLRERLLDTTNPDSETLLEFIKDEISMRPKDVILHIRLLKHFLHSDQMNEAFNHSCNIEFEDKIFQNNASWYDTLSEILKHNALNVKDWLYQLLLLTVKERICVLSLTEVPNGSSRSIVEIYELLSAYDQAIESVRKAGPPSGFGDFYTSLLQHHHGQLAFHIATYLLKKAKRNQLTWRDATKFAGPLMLIAWQIIPLDPKVNWLKHAPLKQHNAVHRWYVEGSYRCSQAGHYILSNMLENSQVVLDQISQFCAGSHWRDKIYDIVFPDKQQLAKSKASYLMSDAFNAPVMRLPRKQEVEAYDEDAQKAYPNSLHHFVWILLNYKDMTKYKCSLFDTFTLSDHGTQSPKKLDVLAFLYSATLTTQNKEKNVAINHHSKPRVLPANITDLLCSITQMKWWDCAYKLSQGELGTDLTGIHATLNFGIEVVRCVDNHGLDPQLLCILGDIFSEKANQCTELDGKKMLEKRACLYYSSGINLLERLKSKVILKIPDKRLFDYNHKDLDTKEINSLIEKCKIYVAISNFNDGEYEKTIELLSNLKSPSACYYTSETYKKLAIEEKKTLKDSEDSDIKYVTLLNKAKHFAYKALEKLKETDISFKDNPLYLDTQQLIEEIEYCLNKVDPDLSNSVINEFLSDENESLVGNEYMSLRSNPTSYHKKNVSSTPKPPKKYMSNINMTNYRTAVESQILETTVMDQHVLERIERQIKLLQKKDTTINDFMEQTKEWFDENRKLGNQIMSTINSNIQTTTEQFKLLKISVDQVKDQIEECKNECKDVGDLKKQLAQLKKEVNKLKKAASEQSIDESELYNLEEEYRGNDNVTGFGAQLPFGPSQVIPQFGRGLVPPFPANPYQLYGQNFYNLYNQYSHFPQVSVPGAPQLFDPTRTQANYPGVYTTPDQMYLDVSHLVAPSIPTVPTVPTIPTIPSVPVPTVSSISSVPIITSAPAKISLATSKVDSKDTPRLPVNVVITSSDPLPACTSAPAPILSVTIPPKHIKVSPHNYQIAMPTTNETKEVTLAPVFSFPSAGSKGIPTVTTTATTITSAANLPSWNYSTAFNKSQDDNFSNLLNFGAKHTDNTRTVVDGTFIAPSPNNSLNKSRTLSEKSNTSTENYDPCPDFKPIIPLPAEVKVTTGEEDEKVIFSSRAKLFRFVDKQWKERGLGEMKLLKHKVTGKVRVLMRREQIHKICANHIISAEMEIKPMKNETKAYIWVANDYAEETLILEKFCIRFKTADIAKQFYDVFENARQEALIHIKSDVNVKCNEESVINNSTPNVTSTPNTSIITVDVGKTVVGGFTFSTVPTFKPVSETENTDQKTTESTSDKTNIFSGLTFKTTSTSPFSNIFNSPSNQNVTSKTVQNSETSNKLNTSDVVEEFEPTVEFKPVIPLPALIDQKTGEENEIVLFEHRAKLLRFDATAKEWKERGLGNIKLLVHKDNVQKLRLLMRREQIMKVCCNHAITKEMVFQKMPKIDKAVTWCAKDFSEGELVAETFCLRFKTVQVCDNFVSAVKTAQSKIKDDSKAVKEEKNAAKQNNEGGFGDKFKPKPGSWHCDTCYTNNLEHFEQCACCEQPKPNRSSSSSTSFTFGFGDKFKPKPGSWECNSCMIRNEAGNTVCSACNSSRDNTGTQKTNSKFTSNNPPMLFGIPGQTQNSLSAKGTNAPDIFSWGDKFKPKEGSWECNLCWVRNDGNLETCSACNNPRVSGNDSGDAKNTNKYDFGIINADTKNKNQVSNLFETPSTQRFNFGIPANQTAIVVSFGEQKATTSVFAITKQPTASDSPINFCLKKADESKSSKPALLPTPQLNWTEIKNFDFMGLKSKEQQSTDNTNVIDFSTNQKNITTKDNKCTENKILENKKKLETKEESGFDDVIFVTEVQATDEEKEKAKELMLPENFYTYKTKDPCPGCRGCKNEDEDVKFEQSAKPITIQQKISFGLTTPLKTTISNFQSPTNSVYGTPNSFDKTVDTSIFRTPIGTTTSSKSASLTSSTNNVDTVDEMNVTNKENTLSEKTNNNTFTAAKGSVLMPPKLGLLSTKDDKVETVLKTEPNVAEIKSIFGEKTVGVSMNQSIFGSNQNKVESNVEPAVKSIFGTDDHKPVNLFSDSSQGSLFGPGAIQTPGSIFGPAAMKNFGSGQSSVFGNVFNNNSSNIFSTQANKPLQTNTTTALDSDSKKESEVKPTAKKDIPFNIDNNLTFAALSTSSPAFNTQKKADFQWEGAGQQLFGIKTNETTNKTSETDGADDSGAGHAGDDEYDPYYEPIVPLPDKVIVTTGEEDEEKLYGERCKLYRYDEKSREWKERGIGEMKLLYHPERNTYRLLLRREQVHKAVLNMLLFKNLALLPMKNSDRAWTWAGQNFAEGVGEHETLAVRFKSPALATSFYDKVVECIKKLQVAPDETKTEQPKETFAGVAPLRLPKHLENSARADAEFSAKFSEHVQPTPTSTEPQTVPNTSDTYNSETTQDRLRQVHFENQEQENDNDDDDDDEEEDYEHDYENSDDYPYEHEEDEDAAVYFACNGEAVVQYGDTRDTYQQAHVLVAFDQDVYSPKILVSDVNTGEVVAEMLIYTDTEFQKTEDTCTWSGPDYTQNDVVNKTVTFTFTDSDTAMQFYDSCESSKAATYTSTDPEG